MSPFPETWGTQREVGSQSGQAKCRGTQFHFIQRKDVNAVIFPQSQYESLYFNYLSVVPLGLLVSTILHFLPLPAKPCVSLA